MSELSDLWEKYPTIQSLLPIKLSNGSRVDDIEMTCGECDGLSIPTKDVHGEIELSTLGAKVKMIARCPVCRKFTFSSGHFLICEGGWDFAFPKPGTAMVNPWTGEVYPVRQPQ